MYGQTRGDRAKGHGEGIENKWVRDSAIFRWCRVFRLGDSALSSALSPPLPPRSSIPPSCFSTLFLRRSVEIRRRRPPCYHHHLRHHHTAKVSRFSCVHQPLKSAAKAAPRFPAWESLVSECVLPLTDLHRKPIETYSGGPPAIGWTSCLRLCLAIASFPLSLCLCGTGVLSSLWRLFVSSEPWSEHESGVL